VFNEIGTWRELEVVVYWNWAENEFERMALGKIAAYCFVDNFICYKLCSIFVTLRIYIALLHSRQTYNS
jgi:hypothetical protein